MKRFMKYIGVVVLTSLATMACMKDNAPEAMNDMRHIEVHSIATRTTIDYEGSDVSHLVWSEGDMVAYVTDKAGDVFRSAEMKASDEGFYFDAEVSAEATTIYVVYPVGENVGKSLSEARLSLVGSIEQSAGDKFSGEMLPMVATEAIGWTDRIDAVYNCIASVVRFTVAGGEGHETEVLKSVTLTANEPLVGDYGVDVASGELAFSPLANSIKLEYKSTTESGEDVLLASSHDIYMVIPSAEFTGVDVVVETDADTYRWSDGAMSLTHPKRRLYRIALDLATSDGAPTPEVNYFKPVTDISEVTDDGTYLIAVKLGGKYYVTNNTPTDTANYYYLTGVEAPTSENGVEATEDMMNYTWSITKRDAGYEFYSENMLKNGTYGVLLITQGGTGMFSNEDGYEGKAWFVPTATVDGYSSTQQNRRYWDIELDGAGKATIRSKYDREVDMFPCYRYCTAHEYFTLCFDGCADKEDISILKLQ